LRQAKLREEEELPPTGLQRVVENPLYEIKTVYGQRLVPSSLFGSVG
jgi:hypothetical protein